MNKILISFLVGVCTTIIAARSKPEETPRLPAPAKPVATLILADQRPSPDWAKETAEKYIRKGWQLKSIEMAGSAGNVHCIVILEKY